MELTINENTSNVNDIYRVCNMIATPKDKKRLAKTMLKLAKAQDKMAKKYEKTPFETLQQLSDDKLPVYTKGMDKALKSFKKNVTKIAKSKKTKPLFFSVKAKADGSIEYVQEDTGRKATTILEHLLDSSETNTRRETVFQIGEINKSRYYSELAEKMDSRTAQRIIAENERKGRDNYYANMNKANERRAKVVEIKGEMDFNDQLAQATYGNTDAAYRMRTTANKPLQQQLGEIEEP